MTHTNIHDPLHVYSNRELPLTQLPVDNTIDTLHRALTICMENPEIPGRIQMAPFIPVEIFRQKSNTFRGIIFSRSYRNDLNFLYHVFGLPAPGFMSRESEKCAGIL